MFNIKIIAKSSLTVIFGTLFVLAFLYTNSLIAHGAAPQAEKTRLIVQLESPVTAQDTAFVRGLGGSVVHEYSLVPAMSVEVPEQAIKGLEKNPRVILIEEDVPVQAMFFDDEYFETWSIDNINADVVHQGGETGAAVKVGIIDSGIDYTHPDLAANYKGGQSFVSRGKPTNDPMDVYGHGTHVAGTVCASMNTWGAVGVAPTCDLYALRVLNDNGSGRTSDILASVEWAVDQGLDVVNLSLGSSGNPGSTAEAVYQAAYDAGLVIVAAGGNSGTSDTTDVNTIWPANYTSVIAVAATDQNDVRAYFSSTGPNVEIAAPGLAVHSTWNDDTSAYEPYPVCDDGTRGCYKDASGTSMASPQVAGVAALILGTGLVSDTNGNGRINDEVRALMNSTALDLDAVGKDNVYGHGLVDAAAAVQAITGPQAPVADAGADQVHEVPAGDPVSVPVTLSGSGADANNDPLNFYWTGGDIFGSSTGATYMTTLTATGTYTYTLTVSDGVLFDTDEVIVTIVEAVPNQAPTASFTHSVTDLTVDLDASGSFDPDGDPLSYSWAFGDGNIGNGVNPSHTYAAEGTYTVTLTVNDGTDTDSVSTDVTVTSPPPSTVTLDASTRFAGPNAFVELSWTGTGGALVDVYRDGMVITTTTGNSYSDKIGRSPASSYTYQVCEAGGTTNCSEEKIVNF